MEKWLQSVLDEHGMDIVCDAFQCEPHEFEAALDKEHPDNRKWVYELGVLRNKEARAKLSKLKKSGRPASALTVDERHRLVDWLAANRAPVGFTDQTLGRALLGHRIAVTSAQELRELISGCAA